MGTEILDLNKLAKWYETNKEPFIRFMLKRYSTLGPDDAEDLYQESIMALHQNICTNQLTELKCSLSTYLIKIGINKANNLLKQNQPAFQKLNEFNWNSLSDLIGDDTNSYQNEVYEEIGRAHV